MKKLLITGISGFIGTHMAIAGIKRGYQIRGTVRSESKAKETMQLLGKYVSPDELKQLNIVEADLLKPDGWDDAVKGVDAILHVASPFIIELPKHEDDLIKPARHGVKHVFEAAVKNGVSRIIQTSSIASVMYGHPKEKTTFNESDWTNLSSNKITPYVKSKTLAEQDVWEFVKKHPQLRVSVVNPGFVLGPLLGNDPGTSGDVIRKFMKGEYPGVPRLGFSTVDVRDVVEVHYRVLENENTIGQRYIATSDSVWFKNMAEFILEAQPGFSNKVKARELPDWFMKLYALFDKPSRMILPELGSRVELSNSKIKAELGITPRTAREATMATANSLVELGLV